MLNPARGLKLLLLFIILATLIESLFPGVYGLDCCTRGQRGCDGDVPKVCTEPEPACTTKYKWAYGDPCSDSDGYYCNGDTLERRDYYCSNGQCPYHVTYSINCATRTSEDTDGGDKPFTKGTVRDYYDCYASSSHSTGYCKYHSYTDTCTSSSTLKEYYPSGSSYGYKYYNCNDYDGFYSGSYRDYYCSNGRCTYTVVCSNECTQGERRCSGDVVQECRTDGDDDPCTEWVDVNDCNSLDGWYNYGDVGPGCNQTDDPTAEYRDYYCSDGSCDYNVTQTKDCDSLDGWYGGGNNSGCGDDPACQYRDYYVNSSGTCVYTTQNCQQKDCDSLDVCGLVCDGPVIREYKDYYCSGGTCVYEWGSVVEDCSTKPSEDTDGGNEPFTRGTVTDYTGCSGGSCTYSTYTDQCLNDQNLTEYYPSGSSYSSTVVDCSSFSGWVERDDNSGYDYNDCSCSSGACSCSITASCTHDCNTGDSYCSGGVLYVCGDASDGDPCRDWVAGGTCECDDNSDCSDVVNADTGADTCHWEDYYCQDSNCVAGDSGDSNCDAYDSFSSTNIHDCEVSSSSCTLGCQASNCCDCSDHLCDSSHLCNTYNFEGTEYTCVYDNGYSWSTSIPDENCSDGKDNDCDGKTDLDDPDCTSLRPNFLVSSVVPVKDHHLVGHAYTYRVTVENDGATGSNTNVSLFVNGAEVDRDSCYVPAGGTCVVHLHWTPSHVGTDLNYVVDPDNTVAETDETDNYYSYETSSCDPLYSYDADEDGNEEYWVDCDGDGNVDHYLDEDDEISTDTDNQDYDGDPTIEYGTDIDGDGVNEGYYDPDTNTFVRFTGKVFVAKVPATGELTFIALSTAGLLVFFVYLLAT